MSVPVRRLLPAFIVMLLLLLAAACGDDDSPDPSPSPAATSTATAPPATATPAPTETPEPTATAPPEPTATPAASPAPPGIIYNGDRESNMVALTFDMGGRVDPALDIMQFLIENQVRATIFMTGAMADNPNTDAGRQVLGLICEYPAQFEPANHSYSHPDFRELTADEMIEEVRTTETAMMAHCNRHPAPLFRPPLGGVDQRVFDVLSGVGYDYVMMWDIDTIDWRPEAEGGPTAQEITAKVLDNARGGSIVLMHLGGYNTLDALPEMVSTLRERGYELVMLSEMLGLPPR